MIRCAFALLSMLIAAPLFAAPDLIAVSLTLSKTSAVTGEPVEATFRVRNSGETATEVSAAIYGRTGTVIFLSAIAPAGWSVTLPPLGGGISFEKATMAAGEEAVFRTTFLMPQRVERPFELIALIGGLGRDANFDNNAAIAPLTLTAAPSNADLQLTLTPQPRVVPEGGAAALSLDVRNDGPDAAHRVHLVVSNDSLDELADVRVSGAGWTCTATARPGTAVCTRESLAAGASSMLEIRGTAPARETIVTISARAYGERIHDRTDAVAYASIGVGDAADWYRLLIPVTSLGRFDGRESPWFVDVTMLVRSEHLIQIRPHPCEFISITCYIGPYPLRRQFDAYHQTILPPVDDFDPGARFVYVRAEDRDKLHVNARVYNENARGRTAGSEIPIVHDEELTTETITLLGIPAGPQYRQTLRVYDTRETAEANVEVRIYADDEREPRVTMTTRLHENAMTQRTTTALLATHPGYAELGLRSFDSELAGAKTLRIEVRPLTSGARIWSFASITNNDTQHVTIATPQ